MSVELEKLTKVLSRLLKLTPETLVSGFRPASVDEIAAVSELRAPNADAKFLARDHAYLHWRYFSRSPGQVDLWVLARDEEILAGIGLERMHFEPDSSDRYFVKIIDLIVRKDLQTMGIAPWMCLHIKANFDQVMVIGSNDNSIRLTKKLWASINIMQTYMQPANLPNFVRNRYPENFVLAALSYPAQIVLSGITRVRRWRLAQDSTVKLFESADELARSVSSAVASTDLKPKQTRRDESYFAWRFDSHPRLRFRATGALDQQGRLLAYLVCAMEPISDTDSGIVQKGPCFAVDWRLFKSAAPEQLALLLVEAQSYFSGLGATTVSALATDPASRKALSMAGFFPRNEDPRFFVFDREQDLGRTGQEDWRITYADTDQLDHVDFDFE